MNRNESKRSIGTNFSISPTPRALKPFPRNKNNENEQRIKTLQKSISQALEKWKNDELILKADAKVTGGLDLESL